VGYFLLAFSTSAYLPGGSFTFKLGNDPEPKQQQVEQKHKKGGPPAHAPANGYRLKDNRKAKLSK
jgi:hypothetical protein